MTDNAEAVVVECNQNIELGDLNLNTDRPLVKKKDDFFCKFHQLTLNIHNHQQINSKKTLILFYNFLILIYIGIQFGLMGVNFQDQDFIEANYYLPFHLLEFWAVFCFTLLESLILIATGNVTTEDWANTLQAGILLFNVVATLTAAIVFSMFPELYEVPAHYMEYSIQILITITDFIFIMKTTNKLDNKWFTYSKITFAVSTFLLSVFQLLIYSDTIPVPMGGERAGHFMEFSNEIANGIFALWYGSQMYSIYNDDLMCHEEKLKDVTTDEKNIL